jgi:hypothetical protein
MAAGDLTVTSVSYATLALAIAAMDADNLPAATDTLTLIQTPGASGSSSFTVIKLVRASA